MNVHTVLALAALAAAILLVIGSSARIAAVVAVVAAALDVTIRLGVVHFGVSGVSLALVIGLALAVPGVLSWLRSNAKSAISAATVVALVGILKVVLALGIRV